MGRRERAVLRDLGPIPRLLVSARFGSGMMQRLMSGSSQIPDRAEDEVSGGLVSETE